MSDQTALPVGTWQLDTSATTITVSVKKLGLFTIPANLTVVSGSIDIDTDHQVVAVEIVADATSYASKSAKRNEHVLSPDFLDATAHPTIAFQTSAVTPDADRYTATGTVTVKGRTTPVDITIADVRFDERNGSFTASAVIDRTTIGIDKMPTFIIGGSIQLSVSAKANKTS